MSQTLLDRGSQSHSPASLRARLISQNYKPERSYTRPELSSFRIRILPIQAGNHRTIQPWCMLKCAGMSNHSSFPVAHPSSFV